MCCPMRAPSPAPRQTKKRSASTTISRSVAERIASCSRKQMRCAKLRPSANRPSDRSPRIRRIARVAGDDAELVRGELRAVRGVVCANDEDAWGGGVGEGGVEPGHRFDRGAAGEVRVVADQVVTRELLGVG